MSNKNQNFLSDFNIKMQNIIKNHIIYENAKSKWINDLLQYSKTSMERNRVEIIGCISIHDGKIFFEVSEEIHRLLFISSDDLYNQYKKTIFELSKLNGKTSIKKS